MGAASDPAVAFNATDMVSKPAVPTIPGKIEKDLLLNRIEGKQMPGDQGGAAGFQG